MTAVTLPWPQQRNLASTIAVPAAACDCARCPFYTANPAAAEPVCSGRSGGCEYCSCSRDLADCSNCSIRCGRRADIAAWMADIGGTVTFDDVELPGVLPAGLPRFIPQIDTADLEVFDAPLRWPAYAVALRRVFSPDSHSLTPVWSEAPARQVLGLSDEQLTVLVCSGKDALLEALWTRRRRDRLIEGITAGGWDLVLAPDYSMYGNQPRAEHLINFRRNLLLAAEFTEAGLTAAPFLHWLRREDIDRYLRWVDHHPPPGPPAVGINLQTCRSQREWDNVLPGLALLAAGLPAPLPVLISGTSRPHRITTLVRLFGERLHLLSHNPLHAARYGGLMTARGRVDHPARTEDLFAANVRFYDSLLRQGSTAPKGAP